MVVVELVLAVAGLPGLVAGCCCCCLVDAVVVERSIERLGFLGIWMSCSRWMVVVGEGQHLCLGRRVVVQTCLFGQCGGRGWKRYLRNAELRNGAVIV